MWNPREIKTQRSSKNVTFKSRYIDISSWLTEKFFTKTWLFWGKILLPTGEVVKMGYSHIGLLLLGYKVSTQHYEIQMKWHFDSCKITFLTRTMKATAMSRWNFECCSHKVFTGFAITVRIILRGISLRAKESVITI